MATALSTSYGSGRLLDGNTQLALPGEMPPSPTAATSSPVAPGQELKPVRAARKKKTAAKKSATKKASDRSGTASILRQSPGPNAPAQSSSESELNFQPEQDEDAEPPSALAAVELTSPPAVNLVALVARPLRRLARLFSDGCSDRLLAGDRVQTRYPQGRLLYTHVGLVEQSPNEKGVALIRFDQLLRYGDVVPTPVAMREEYHLRSEVRHYPYCPRS